MCGIAGLVALAGGRPPDEATLRAMRETLVHRGPDDEGSVVKGPVGLAMRRLSVIDVEGGRQPYVNEDGTVRAVFNGEIYNFRALRRELEAKGHRFSSAADGEVILHLWEEYGPSFPEKLNGMFGIALHDAHAGRLLLVRDRAGIKPLFYARTAGHLVFGSEVKAILASGLVGRTLDMDALGQFFAWEYVPAPGTLFQGIRKLEPGTLLDLDLATGTIRHDVWWDVPHPEHETHPSDQEWEEAVDEAVSAAVRRQLVSDVPLGAFLSGGVDSSLVVSAMGPAKAFSIGFDDESYNEVSWASAVARHLGLDHDVEIIEPDAVALFDRLMHFMDDPIADFSIFPTYMVSRLARDRVTVALTGDGGDELFGGYETYAANEMARPLGLVPAGIWRRGLGPVLRLLPPTEKKKGLVNKVKRFGEGLGMNPALGHARWRLFADDTMRRALFSEDARSAMTTPASHHVTRLASRAGERSAIDRALYIDFKSYLADNCLVKVDRMSMACSLEARVPLLDHEVIELAFRLPGRLKVAGGRTKPLLKRVAARHVPPDCVYRPKEGFSIPIKAWLGGAFRPLVEELLAPERISSEGIFRPSTVARLRDEHFAGRANHSHILWAMLVFADWRRRWGA